MDRADRNSRAMCLSRTTQAERLRNSASRLAGHLAGHLVRWLWNWMSLMSWRASSPELDAA